MAEKLADLRDPRTTDLNHPQHITIQISVRNQDTITWVHDQDFEVVNIHQIDGGPRMPVDVTKPANPFFRLLPFKGYRETDGLFRANSGPAVPAAIGQRYKATSRLSNTLLIDSDFIVGNGWP